MLSEAVNLGLITTAWRDADIAALLEQFSGKKGEEKYTMPDFDNFL